MSPAPLYTSSCSTVFIMTPVSSSSTATAAPRSANKKPAARHWTRGRLGVGGRIGSHSRAVGGAEVVLPFGEADGDVAVVGALDPAAVGGAAGVVAPGVSQRDRVGELVDADDGVDVTLDDVVAVLE